MSSGSIRRGNGHNYFASSDDSKICVVMVGLPARGKSLIAGKAMRYLAWVGIPARVFNVGSYRRAGTPQPNANFFDPHNTEGEKMRRAAAEAAVSDMLQWFQSGKGVVAILDATNSTKERRRWIHERCQEANVETLYVESICDDEDLIMNNILEVKTTSPDYKGQDPEVAALDFRNRIRNYEKVYETIDDNEKHFTYVKLINVGSTVIINQIKDYLSSRLVYYIQNLHIKPRSIWLSRHGESEYNLTGKIGGDSNISERGEAYARALPGLLKKSGVPPNTKIVIWTSTLKRTIQTARHLAAETGFEKLEWKALDELDSGVCDGLTYEQIAEKYPEDFAARDEDKYNYRYRGGESYRDVVIRLEPIIMELERSENVIIVTHQAVLRCIYAYFLNTPQEQSPWMEVPLHTLIKLTPRAYGTDEQRFKADIPAVSTWRAKGTGSVLAYGDRVLAGLNNGSLRIYRVNEEEEEEQQQHGNGNGNSNGETGIIANGTTNGNREQQQHSKKPTELLREVEKFSRYKIEQLALIKEAKVLVSLSGGYVSLHDLGTYSLQEQLGKTKGATTFAVTSNIENDSETGVPAIVSRVAVAVKRKIMVWVWRDMEMEAGGPMEMTLVSGIKTLTWVSGTRLVAGLGSGFVMVDIEGDGGGTVTDLTGPSGIGGLGGQESTGRLAGVGVASMSYMGLGGSAPKPLATRLKEGQVLLAKDINTHFIDVQGNSLGRRQIPWSHAPADIGYSYPFLLALHDASKGVLEVRNPETLSLLQSVPLPSASIMHIPQPTISLAHAGKGFLVASDRTIWRMEALSYDTQIDSLVEKGYLDEAISLASMLEDALLRDKQGRLRQIKLEKAEGLFKMRKYTDSMDLFTEISAPPETVIRLYPKIIAGELSSIVEEPEESEDGTTDSQSKTQENNSPADAPAAEEPPAPKTLSHAPSVMSLLRTRTDDASDAGSIRGKVVEDAKSDKALEGADLKLAVRDLQRYLADVRRRFQRFLNPDGTLKVVDATTDGANDALTDSVMKLLSIDPEGEYDLGEKLREKARLVDTTLFRAYMYAIPALAGSLFRIANFCDPDVVMEKLEETGRHNDLIDFLYGKKLHRQALELLQKFGQADEEEETAPQLHGPKRTVNYLQNLSPDHIDLILEFAEWPVRQDPELGMEIFLADTENAETLPRERVLDFLQGIDVNLAVRYLEHIIGELNDMTPDLHQKLLVLYLERLKKHQAKEWEFSSLDDYSSSQYSPAKILDRLDRDDPEFFEARAIVFSKMGQHRQALEIYVFKLEDYVKAEEYCNHLHKVEDTTAADGAASRCVALLPYEDDKPPIYLTLLSLYLSPPHGYKPRYGPALEVLAKHGSRLPPNSALDLIPETLPVKELEFYFKGRMRAANTILNESRIVANLQKAEDIKTQAQLLVGEGTDGRSTRSRHVTITEERVCGICHKRIGGSVINVFPDEIGHLLRDGVGGGERGRNAVLENIHCLRSHLFAHIMLRSPVSPERSSSRSPLPPPPHHPLSQPPRRSFDDFSYARPASSGSDASSITSNVTTISPRHSAFNPGAVSVTSSPRPPRTSSITANTTAPPPPISTATTNTTSSSSSTIRSPVSFMPHGEILSRKPSGRGGPPELQRRSRHHSQGFFEPSLPTASSSEATISASRIAAQAAMLQQQQTAPQNPPKRPPPVRGVSEDGSRSRRGGSASPPPPPPPAPLFAPPTSAGSASGASYQSGSTNGNTHAATTAANVVFPRNPALQPPGLEPPVEREHKHKGEKSKMKLFSKPKHIGISRDKDGISKDRGLPSPSKMGFPSGGLSRIVSASTTSLADTFPSNNSSLYNLSNASASTVVPADKPVGSEKEKEKDKDKHKHHFLSRQKLKLKDRDDHYNLPLSSASSNSKPSDPNAPQSLYSFTPASPGAVTTTFGKSVSGLDLLHGLRDKKKEEKALDSEQLDWVANSSGPAPGTFAGPSSLGSSTGVLAEAALRETLQGFGLNNMTPEDAWDFLKAKLMVIFDGEDVRIAIEDLNKLVLIHIQRCVQKRMPTAVVDDLRELLETGCASLNHTLNGIPDEKLVPHLVQVWMLVFGTILPFIQAVFLPLDLEFKGCGSVMNRREASEFWSSTFNGEYPGCDLDVRNLVLIAFRDMVILYRYDVLKATFSRLSLDSIKLGTAALSVTTKSSSNSARPTTSASLDGGFGSYSSQSSTLLNAANSYSSDSLDCNRSRAASNTSNPDQLIFQSFSSPTQRPSIIHRSSHTDTSHIITETVGRMLQCVSVLASVQTGDRAQEQIELLSKELKHNWLGRGRTGRDRRGFVGTKIRPAIVARTDSDDYMRDGMEDYGRRELSVL
ncbi:HbrB-domain-containing protein [Aspergillus costaricaensis CBS 115574]|uniref:HbrB-domain-containing protein n=1 Tax=Aspergillus costaricaensis CBS 115574 TaxID=1448317 RepID=A0ACD1IH31_9EURO|nr:HbrB-domain-containing protein [Aspergillus costaricaensis CBS 115574]RAK89866.1 HbrB-domain-containing protein [Aspergillus costaricaensis CBS 115574]